MDNSIINQTLIIIAPSTQTGYKTKFIASHAPTNKYYVTGVVFMIFVIGLLLYVNFFYEYPLRVYFFKMLDSKLCCCFRIVVFNCIYMYQNVFNLPEDTININNDYNCNNNNRDNNDSIRNFNSNNANGYVNIVIHNKN
jgi:hypothetical protein